MFTDSHCHLHDADFPINQSEALELAHKLGVNTIIVVGTDQLSSQSALDFASEHPEVFCSVGVHPHESQAGADFLTSLDYNHPKLIAIGEIGLDYHYDYSPRAIQRNLFKRQIEIALDKQLPIIFHVREAFEDFWPIVDQYQIDRAVVHSYSDNLDNLAKILAKGWYVGVNGIITFTKDLNQLAAYDAIPLDKLLIETDAPYLAPKPFRGQPNQPAYVVEIAQCLANRRNLPIESIARASANNARQLFNIQNLVK